MKRHESTPNFSGLGGAMEDLNLAINPATAHSVSRLATILQHPLDQTTRSMCLFDSIIARAEEQLEQKGSRSIVDASQVRESDQYTMQVKDNSIAWISRAPSTTTRRTNDHIHGTDKHNKEERLNKSDAAVMPSPLHYICSR